MLLAAGPGIVGVVGSADLSARERAVLDFERTWWRDAAEERKSLAIRRRLGLSASRYYQVLDDLCDSDAAIAYDPLLVRRLRRRRTERRIARFLGRPVPRSGHH